MNKNTFILLLALLIILIAIESAQLYLTLSEPADRSEAAHQAEAVFSEEELADYLNLSVADVEAIVKKDTAAYKELSASGGGYSFDTYAYIPFITFGDETVFLKSEIDQWLEYKSKNFRFMTE